MGSKEKLEIKHLKNYSDHNLQWIELDIESGEYEILLMHGFNFMDNEVHVGDSRIDLNSKLSYGSICYKPILRHLRDLTKEINGVIPLEYMGLKRFPFGLFSNGVFGWDSPTWGDDVQDYYLTIESENDIISYCVWQGQKEEGGFVIEQYELPYTWYLNLLEWNFDVSGLIEKGLAFDLNKI